MRMEFPMVSSMDANKARQMVEMEGRKTMEKDVYKSQGKKMKTGYSISEKILFPDLVPHSYSG